MGLIFLVKCIHYNDLIRVLTVHLQEKITVCTAGI